MFFIVPNSKKEHFKVDLIAVTHLFPPIFWQKKKIPPESAIAITLLKKEITEVLKNFWEPKLKRNFVKRYVKKPGVINQ